MKYKVAGVNLFFSQVVIIVFLSFAYSIWLPFSFTEFSGFSKSVQTIILINLCLGPLLILLIYKKNKRGLKADLYILSGLQVAAFLFGAYSIYMKHPVYAVFTVDRFTLINASSASPHKVRYEEFKTSFFSSPKLAYVKAPGDIKKLNEILMGVVLEGKPDLDEHAEYYEPFYNHTHELLSRSLAPKLILSNETSRTKLNVFIAKYGGTVDDYAYFPLRIPNGSDAIWIFTKSTLQPIDTISIDPWALIKDYKKKTEHNDKIELKPWQMMARKSTKKGYQKRQS